MSVLVACLCVMLSLCCLCVMLSLCCSHTANSIAVHSPPYSGTYSTNHGASGTFGNGTICFWRCAAYYYYYYYYYSPVFTIVYLQTQVSTVHSVAVFLYLQFVLHVMLFPCWMFCPSISALSAVCVQRSVWLFSAVPWCRAFRYVVLVLSEWFWHGSSCPVITGITSIITDTATLLSLCIKCMQHVTLLPMFQLPCHHRYHF